MTLFLVRLAGGAANEPRDLTGIEFLQRAELAVGIAANSAKQVPQLLLNDNRADVLVRDAELFEVLVVKEVPERPVSHVVQQRRQPDEAFDIRSRRHVRARRRQRFVPAFDGDRRQVHRAQDMLEPHVLGRREDPPRGLQLVDVPQPLHPRMIDQRLFGHFARGQRVLRDERDVAVNRIVRQTFGVEITRHAAVLAMIEWQRHGSRSMIAIHSPHAHIRSAKSAPRTNSVSHRAASFGILFGGNDVHPLWEK